MVFGWAGALPSVYSRTAGREFDKGPKKFSGPLLRSLLGIGPEIRGSRTSGF
jgi:hypothetical protein